MITKELATADKITQAVAAVKALRPAYEGLLDFYEKLFLAQQASKQETHMEPIKIPQDLLSLKQAGKFPLINMADFALDMKASEVLLRKVCQLAVDANDVLAEAGPKIVDALDKGTLDSSSLFSSILEENDTYLDNVARRLRVDKKILAFAAYSSIKPSLCLCAEQLAAHLDKEATWGKGYCPVCGNPPALSILQGEGGERYLLCSFCGHEWRTYRIYCPFCENRDQKTLHYFLGEGEKDYRVDVCDQCKKYIKTIDVRQMKRPVCAFIEQISTLHLDMMAQEQGLESGVPLWLQT
jgi:FdhE protein